MADVPFWLGDMVRVKADGRVGPVKVVRCTGPYLFFRETNEYIHFKWDELEAADA